jgi:endonuclease/exonuclease/phosphatase (EEP) superfamily protein YafD
VAKVENETLVKHLKKLLHGLAIAPVVLVAVLTLCAACESMYWRNYLIAQFRLQIAIGALILMAILLIPRSTRKYAAITAILAAVHCAYVLPVCIPKPIAKNDRQAISFLQINVNNRNERYEDVLHYVGETKPDVLLITELNDPWKKAFDSLTEYKYSCTAPRPDTYGIAVYSKRELIDAQVKVYGSFGHPSIVCKVENADQPMTLVHTHIQGPIKLYGFDWHREQILIMAKELKKLDKPLVVTGDTNSTPWTYLLSGLMKECDLVDTRSGFGMQLSWPAPINFWKYPFVLIPIDNCFVTPEIDVLERNVGPFIGSDHYPIWIKLARNSRQPTVKP